MQGAKASRHSADAARVSNREYATRGYFVIFWNPDTVLQFQLIDFYCTIDLGAIFDTRRGPWIYPKNSACNI